MKTYKKLYPNLITFKNLYKAFYKAKKGNSTRFETLLYFFNLEKKLFQIQNELILKTYKTGKYRIFKIYEPKERIIKAIPFKDRIVQHALCNIIEPIFESRFIFNSFACRKKKGIHKGLERVRKLVQNYFKDKNGYALKCDIKKYFQSIDHNKLKKIIQRKIKDKQIINLINGIIDSDSSQFGKDKGIPIGNLTSQLFANIYLNELDQFVKHSLKIKHYFRYVDDFLIFSESKQKLHIYKYKIREFLKTLKLKIPYKKTNIYKINTGVDFLGYKIHLKFIRIRKSNIKRFIKRTKKLKNLLLINSISKMKIESSIQSWIGYTSHANSYKICNLIIEKIAPEFLYLL